MDRSDLLNAGGHLANCAFNLAQSPRLTDDERRSLDESRKAWDAAVVAAPPPPAEQAGGEHVETLQLIGNELRQKCKSGGVDCEICDRHMAALEAARLALSQRPVVDEAMVFRLAVWMAKNDGHDDPHHLIWEGSPPEPWGEVWNRYEDDARAALTAALAPQQPEKGEQRDD